jgi:hypothetical protein
MELLSYKIIKSSSCLTNKGKRSYHILYPISEKEPFDCVEFDVDDENDNTKTLKMLPDELFEMMYRGELEDVVHSLPEEASLVESILAMFEYIKNELGSCFPDDVAEQLQDRINAIEWYDRY